MNATHLWKALSYSDGRAGRTVYWLGLALLSPPSLLFARIGGPLALLLVVMTWFWVCLIAKRLHDLGRAGPWMIPFALVGLPAILSGAVFRLQDPLLTGHSQPDPLALGSAAVWLGFLLVVGLLPGQKSDNRFGPSPGRGAN